MNEIIIQINGWESVCVLASGIPSAALDLILGSLPHREQLAMKQMIIVAVLYQ